MKLFSMCLFSPLFQHPQKPEITTKNGTQSETHQLQSTKISILKVAHTSWSTNIINLYLRYPFHEDQFVDHDLVRASKLLESNYFTHILTLNNLMNVYPGFLATTMTSFVCSSFSLSNSFSPRGVLVKMAYIIMT